MQTVSSNPAPPTKAPTGVEGLDDILEGGLPRDEIYLVQGAPGTGKTTLGLQFLLEGTRVDESALYISLSQTRRGLEKIAESHGWSLHGVHVHELRPGASEEAPNDRQVIFHTADVELGETLEAFFAAIQELGPSRIVFDSMAEIRLLAGDALNYRREILAIKQFFADRFCTVMLLDDKTSGLGDIDLAGMVHGIIELEQESPQYGEVRRQLSVLKMRGMTYTGGYHNFRIHTGGLRVYPRLAPGRQEEQIERRVVKSGVDELDRQLGGGLVEGTTCLLMGPSGTGKTSVGLCYAYASAQRGERAAVFLFDEQLETFYMRAAGLGMDVRPLVREGRIGICQINTGEFSPSEFAQMVRQAVEEKDAKVVIIDSLTGYVNAMLKEQLLISQMHELLTYLSRRGVLSLLVVAQQGQLGEDAESPLNLSYMADALLLFRHFEKDGELRQAMYILKKRHGPHEKTARTIQLTSEGVQIGSPLQSLENISFDFGI